MPNKLVFKFSLKKINYEREYGTYRRGHLDDVATETVQEFLILRKLVCIYILVPQNRGNKLCMCGTLVYYRNKCINGLVQNYCYIKK